MGKTTKNFFSNNSYCNSGDICFSVFRISTF